MVEKEHILLEIRRTAAENGGVALGRQRFSAETGIRDSDWRGRYWARWSEACAEAGFAPNKLTGALDESFLLEKLVALAREVGHVPVFAELRLQGTRDPNFPNDKTFSSRFGSKQQIVQRLARFCEERGYSDVLQMCSPGPSAAAARSAPASEPTFGFVYLLRYGRHYKIGRSNSVGRRERELAIQLPERTKLIHAIKTDDPEGIEHYWHRRFESKRGNGEWFELTPQDIAAFRRRKFM
jgi:hypothetical protein